MFEFYCGDLHVSTLLLGRCLVKKKIMLRATPICARILVQCSYCRFVVDSECHFVVLIFRILRWLVVDVTHKHCIVHLSCSSCSTYAVFLAVGFVISVSFFLFVFLRL